MTSSKETPMFDRALRIWAALAAVALAACGGGNNGAENELTGAIEIDGSSTVYPISEALAEEFQIMHPRTRVTVGVSGTGGGFKRFCAGETDISDASRPIVEDEIALCEQNGVEYTEVRIAWDGLSVLVNPANDFAQCLTVEELRRIWEPGSTVSNWSQVRAGFPDQRLILYGPGTDSGTFDYFTEVIAGESGASRPDYTASEDDNVLVQGVAGDASALGYFGFAYYEENQDKLKLVAVDGGAGCVLPTVATIESGEYAPLSRPLFLYVSDRGLEKEAVREFFDFALTEGAELVRSVGYIPLKPEQYEEELAEVRALAEDGGTGPAEDPAPAPEDETAPAPADSLPGSPGA
ncbi:MAG TPA: PstS family phosphate ABC transporter substrate-binding protein [Gemmatimonadota bacterium]|nr:PstS family phosphate ABC transporter substrate-binding protein [Gemmatimonadota bacterium]